MFNELSKKVKLKKKRALRVRKRLKGTLERPRLCVNKSNKHLSAQIIDDDAGKTLASVATCDKDLKGTEIGRKNRSSARQIGTKLAELAKKGNIKSVVFDRGGAKYHGLLAELAEGAREGGLEF